MEPGIVSGDLSTQYRSVRRGRCAVMMFFAILIAGPSASLAQTKKPQRKTPPVVAPKPSKFDCGGSVELRVSAATPAQGTLLIAELRSPDALSGVSGKWIDRDISFCQVTGGATVPKGVS